MTLSSPATKPNDGVSPATPLSPAHEQSNYRWLVCALLFFGFLINYIDRQILALLKPMLDDQLHWTNTQFGMVNSAFGLAYALSLMGFGWWVDRFGTKLGYAISIVAWSLAAAGHALVGSISGFFVARVALGLGEGGSFPSSIKSIALWFSQEERALATSLFNSGANVGALIAPAMIPLVALRWGWRAPFVLAGAAGFVWLIFWLALYKVPAKPATDTSDVADTDDHRVPLGVVLRHRQAWSFVVAKTLTDPVWGFLLVWSPDFYKKTRHLDIKNSWPHLVTIYAIVTVLSILGGWIPGQLVRAGFRPSNARKLTMLLAALTALGSVFATQASDWGAVVLIGLTGAAHQAWAANLYTTVGDMFPKSVVAGLVGFGSMMSGFIGLTIPLLIGMLLDHYTALNNITRGYSLMFGVCGVAYIVAFAVQHLLAPRFEPVELNLEVARA